VAGHEFVFALELSDEPPFDTMLSDLAVIVLAHLGYSRAAADELRHVVGGALRAGAANGKRRCDIRFRAHDGELEIVVSYPDGARWRTARPLPQA
jgi:hypothetical protein